MRKGNLPQPQENRIFSRRLDLIIGQLPEAMRQAHERIIGERQVPSNEKNLESL